MSILWSMWTGSPHGCPWGRCNVGSCRIAVEMFLLAMPPHVPAALKGTASMLARAEQVAKADPVMAYWCAYFRS